MDYGKAISRIYERLESGDVESAVMGCLRIARHAKDYVNAAVFLRELYPDKKEVYGALYDDLSPLKEEAQKAVLEISLKRWLELHTVDTWIVDQDRQAEDKKNVFLVAVGELDSELDQWERAVGDLTIPATMGAFDAAAFTDRFVNEKAAIRGRIKCLQTIKARLKARCLNYAIQIERQLQSQKKGLSFLERVQNDANNFFKVRAEDVYRKCQKAADLWESDDPEDAALLLTEVRRALKSAADYFYPPVDGKVRCSDGQERILGEEQYLNRLQEFINTRFSRSTAREVLRSELDHLGSFLRRLNDLASKGVHSEASLVEAKQSLVGLYLFLYNAAQHLQRKEESPNA